MNGEAVTYFALTDSRGKRTRFGIKSKDRSKHTYIIGKTGMGKSTVLENMAVQDIQNGEGLAFVDPHGKTAELLLEYIPEHRIKDVLYFAPFDMEHPISFNVMEDVGLDKRHLVVNGLMSTFEKIWADAWSARMAYILNNTLLALLEYPGATLLGVNRMLSDKDYRKKVVDNITDPSVRSFWVDEFAKYTDRFAAEATPAIQNKVGQFTSNPLVRNLIGQPRSTFDLRKMMDEKKIVIINLSKGKVGESNANLIGSMLITKIYLAAMSRADASEGALKDLPQFNLYVDEFQSFANKSFADILSEARKYKLSLTIAHQYIEQMEEEVRAAVFGNVGTMVVFRVGAYDAEVLEKEFAPQFSAEDIVNLGVFQIYLKLMIDGVSSVPFSAVTMPPIPKDKVTYQNEVIKSSREAFSRPRAEVEKVIRDWHAPISQTVGNGAGNTPHTSASHANSSQNGNRSQRDFRDHRPDHKTDHKPEHRPEHKPERRFEYRPNIPQSTPQPHPHQNTISQVVTQPALSHTSTPHISSQPTSPQPAPQPSRTVQSSNTTALRDALASIMKDMPKDRPKGPVKPVDPKAIQPVSSAQPAQSTQPSHNTRNLSKQDEFKQISREANSQPKEASPEELKRVLGVS